MKSKQLILSLTLIFFLGVILLSSSCASRATRLTGVWADPSRSGQPIESVMIIAIAKEPKNRRIFEHQFTRKFQENGVKAMSSVTVLKDKDANTQEKAQAEKEKIQAAALQNNMDAVLVTHVVGIESETVETQPVSTTLPLRGSERFGSYYKTAANEVYFPAGQLKYEKYKLETNLYDTKTEKLIYSASSQILNPQNLTDDAVVPLTDEIIKSLKKEMLIQ
jgi:hypothetical protein